MIVLLLCIIVGALTHWGIGLLLFLFALLFGAWE